MQAAWPCEYIFLALLCERPMHGYELFKLVSTDKALCTIWRIERSQLYFLLRKLKAQGHITQTAEEQVGGPPRLIYAPTRKGREVLAQWLDTPERYTHDLRAAFLAKLYLVLRSEPQIAASLIEKQKRVLREWAERQRERTAGNDFSALVSKLRLSQTQAALDWLDQIHTLIPVPN